jgi:hypothetical protein
LKKDFYLEISLNKNTQKIIVGQPAMRGGMPPLIFAGISVRIVPMESFRLVIVHMDVTDMPVKPRP